MDAGGAERLGARLLGEVEECGLSELLTSLRVLVHPQTENQIFNISELDALLPTPAPEPAPLPHHQHQHPRSDDDSWSPNPQNPPIQPYTIREAKKALHILELVSPPHAHHPSLSGKTSLLHLLITHAILPRSLSTVPLLGKNAAIILIDPLHHFSVGFLAKQLLTHIASAFKTAGKDVTVEHVQQEIQHCVKRCLSKVHIFHPSSWGSLLSTLQGLDTYLFDTNSHASTHHPISSLLLDDIDAFIPAIKVASSPSDANPLLTASSQLTHELERLANMLSCTVVTTSRAVASNSFRAPIPLAWPGGMQLTRLAVRRVEVVRFAPGLSVDEVERERGQRWEVVGRGRFEVFRVGGGKEVEGFVFKVGEGVRVEREGG